MPIKSGAVAAPAATAPAAAAAASTAAAAKDAAAAPQPLQGAPLPHEVLVRIFELLPPGELAVTPGRVCRAWAAAKADVWKAVAASEALNTHDERAYPLLPSWYARSLFGDNLFPHKDDLVHAAARHGQLDLLADYYETGRRHFTALACRAAAAWANLDALKWLRERRVKWDENVTNAAACSGDLSVLRFCVENSCPWIDEFCLRFAAENGSLEMIDWILKKGCHWTPRACAFAAASGQIHVLAWARERGLCHDEDVCTEACENGQLEVLKFCLAKGDYPLDVKQCVKAARGRHPECYEWLVANVPGAASVEVDERMMLRPCSGWVRFRGPGV